MTTRYVQYGRFPRSFLHGFGQKIEGIVVGPERLTKKHPKVLGDMVVILVPSRFVVLPVRNKSVYF